jgi:hypothetical protein
MPSFRIDHQSRLTPFTRNLRNHQNVDVMEFRTGNPQGEIPNSCLPAGRVLGILDPYSFDSMNSFNLFEPLDHLL